MTRTRARLLLAILLLLVVGTTGAAQTAYTGGYESLTFAATASGFTLATLRPTDGQGQARVCSGRLEAAQIRYRYDGVAPTAAEGELLEIGDRIRIEGPVNLVQFQGIRTGATSGVLKMTCAR